MTQYAQQADCTDPSIRVSESHLAGADVLVDVDLWAKGIDPAEVLNAEGAILPTAAALLRQLAVAHASAQAAREQTRGEGSWLLEKADGYGRQAKDIAARISRAALGILAEGETQRPPVGIGTVEIGRG